MTFEEAVKKLNLIDPIDNQPLSASELIEVLKEDVVLAVERPGSWEGDNMITVLQSHGFI